MELNGLRVSRETQRRLEHFVSLFRKWASTINLVAPSTVENLWQRHVLDSVQIFQINPQPQHWVDLGSGAGFPGIVTAILLADLQGGHVDLIESNQKKSAFLRVCLRECEARGAVHAVRIEDAVKTVPICDVISARALADLDSLLSYGEGWAKSNSDLRFLLHKGRDYQAEIEKARGRWGFDLLKHSSVVEQDSVILDITQLRRKS
jgi:16S rRNA (guanine527-N7)-methyltransferase